MAMDPICKMEVNEETAQWTSEVDGKKFYFCAPGCKASFDQDPAKYLDQDMDGHGHHGRHGCGGGCCGH